MTAEAEAHLADPRLQDAGEIALVTPVTSSTAGYETARWELKYRVKYKVRSLMNHLVEGPVSCSTPRPGTNGVTGNVVATIRVPGDLNALMKKVKDLWVMEADIEEMKLVERYVCKYFFKLKMKRKL